MTPPNIPPGEMTSMFKSIWMKEENPINNNFIVENELQNQKQDIPQSKDEAAEDNYQQLQRDELYKLLGEINRKVDAADKSFDKPYWEGNNAGKVTMQATNPKQESLDILRSAIAIIERAKYPENKGGLYHLIAMKSLNYTGRVFGYEAKQDFFTLAAELVNKADQLITKNRYVKDDLSEAYCTSGDIWREMTRKALWGNHAYNKMACDKIVIQQYERAVQANPNNTKAKRILEQLKTPKKAVPAAVEKLEKIPDETWNNAQEEMFKREDEIRQEEMTKLPDVNYLPIAEITLSGGSTGTVSLLRSGSMDWEVIEEGKKYEISVNDKIRTSEDAKNASVTYQQDKTYLAIKSGSEVEFQDGQIYISRGNIHLRVIKRGSKFLVITPTCAVGVRGTEFEVKVNDDKTAETYLYEGVVEIRNGSDIAYLEPGQKITAKKGEPKLQQSNFNAIDRKESNWARIEEQLREHEQIKMRVPAKSFGTRKSSTVSKNQTNRPLNNTSPFTNALIADISTSPDNKFHTLLSSVSVDYGDAALVARCPVNVQQNTSLTVNWYLNNQPQPISIGNYDVVPQATHFDATLISYDAPINPGTYRAEFVINGQVFGKGSVMVNAPLKMNLQAAQQSYVDAVKLMESALSYVDQAEFTNAGQQSRSALPGLQNALFNDPSLPDVLTVWYTAQSIIALDKVNQESFNGDAEKTLGWLAIASAYINLAYNNCQDQQFKVTVQNLKVLIDQL